MQKYSFKLIIEPRLMDFKLNIGNSNREVFYVLISFVFFFIARKFNYNLNEAYDEIKQKNQRRKKNTQIYALHLS